MWLPVELQAALTHKVPCRTFVRSWKQPRCDLTAEESKGDAKRVIGMLLNLSPVKVPPFLCCFLHKRFQLSLDHQCLLDVWECGNLPCSFKQAKNEWGFWRHDKQQVLLSSPPSFLLRLAPLFSLPISPGTLTINSLLPALFSSTNSSVSLFWTTSSLTE